MNAQNVAIQCRQEGGEKVMGRKKSQTLVQHREKKKRLAFILTPIEARRKKTNAKNQAENAGVIDDNDDR